jgi:drug/metabolite transporter (DMT)-like permease
MTNVKGIFGWYKEAQKNASEGFLRQGRVRTVWIGGVLIFGGTMFLITTVSEFLYRPHELSGIWEVGWLALSLFLWGLAGYIFGAFRWRRAMRQRPK